jgi:cytochrome c1
MAEADAAGRLDSRALRRLAPLVVLAALAVGCGTTVPGGKNVTTPTPATVIGPLPRPPSAVVGNAAAGKPVFLTSGCAACHTFTPAAATGKIGPNLDNLAVYAQKAGKPLEPFIRAAIVSPPASYVPPGFPTNVMPTTYGTSLTAQQLADVVAFLAKGP